MSTWRELYERYRQSSEWYEKRRKVFERARGVCEGCGERRAREVHHRRYPDALPGSAQWISLEKLWDLAAVCERCHEEVHKSERKERDKEMAKKNGGIVGGKGAPGVRGGKPGRAGLHEGPAGAGAVSRSKFGKETRDALGEKEPGKSRGR